MANGPHLLIGLIIRRFCLVFVVHGDPSFPQSVSSPRFMLNSIQILNAIPHAKSVTHPQKPAAACIGVSLGIGATLRMIGSERAVVFSTLRVQSGYHRVPQRIDALMGRLLMGLGAKLALDH